MRELTKRSFDKFIKRIKKEPMFQPPGRIAISKKCYEILKHE